MKQSFLMDHHCGYASNPTVVRVMPNGDVVETLLAHNRPRKGRLMATLTKKKIHEIKATMP